MSAIRELNAVVNNVRLTLDEVVTKWFVQASAHTGNLLSSLSVCAALPKMVAGSDGKAVRDPNSHDYFPSLYSVLVGLFPELELPVLGDETEPAVRDAAFSKFRRLMLQAYPGGNDQEFKLTLWGRVGFRGKQMAIPVIAAAPHMSEKAWRGAAIKAWRRTQVEALTAAGMSEVTAIEHVNLAAPPALYVDARLFSKTAQFGSTNRARPRNGTVLAFDPTASAEATVTQVVREAPSAITTDSNDDDIPF